MHSSENRYKKNKLTPRTETIIIAVYLVLFFVAILGVHVIFEPIIIGEWDDYTMPIASIIYNHRIDIYPEDITNYMQLFPRWKEYVSGYKLSPFYTKAGGQMPFYFPTYAMLCVPVVLVLQLLKIDTTYAFMLVNLFWLMVALIFVARKFKDFPFYKRFLLIVALSINPIVFYVSWPSAEVFMYAMVLMGITYWYQGCKKKAAVCISIAGTLNPTVLAIGIIMILNWFVKLILHRDKEDSFGMFFKKNIKDALEYACCYVIGIIPMIYNYYQVGMINLTAQDGSVVPFTTTLKNMVAYLFDFNFGYLPYFPIVLGISFLLLIIAIIKKNRKYLVWMLAFIATLFSYSLMIYVNCGMSGISRYDAWCSSFLVLGIFLFVEELIDIKKLISLTYSLVLLGVIYVGGILCWYYPVGALNTAWNEMTPIASFVLDHFPSLYSPLPTTFNSRVNQTDGVEEFETPVVYTSSNGYVTKILATSKDKETLLHTYESMTGYNAWFKETVDALGEEMSYISIAEKYQIVEK